MDLTHLGSEHSLGQNRLGRGGCKCDRDVEVAFWEPPGKRELFLEVIFPQEGGAERQGESGQDERGSPQAAGAKAWGWSRAQKGPWKPPERSLGPQGTSEGSKQQSSGRRNTP